MAMVWPGLDAMRPFTGAVGVATRVALTGRNLSVLTDLRMRPMGDMGLGQPCPFWEVISETEAEALTIVADEPATWAWGLFNGNSATWSTANPFAFAPAPTVTGVVPRSGLATGGQVMVISGTGLDLITAVRFGTKDAQFTGTPSVLDVVVPAGEAGPVEIILSFGETGRISAGNFTYIVPTVRGMYPNQGRVVGGDPVTIAGSLLNIVTAVTFGATSTAFTATADTITTVSPRGEPGQVAVSLAAPTGRVAVGNFTFYVGPEEVEFVSADGLRATLEVERGSTGRFMPPVDIWEDVVPLTPGARFRGARHAARTLTLPLVAPGNRYGRNELRTLARVFDPLRGIGRLRLISGPGAGREINCVYLAGLESMKEEFPQWSRLAVQFRAVDPYWTDGTDFVREFAPANIETEWFPIFPLDLAGTNISGEFSITNSGDADAWPRIEVAGPGRDFGFDNLTTGRTLNATGEIPAGRRLVITTQPGERGVSLDNGENWFSHLDRSSTLWGLSPGFNQLRVRYLTDAGRITLRWRLRYLTP